MTYDHISSDEMLEKIRSSVGSNPLVPLSSVRPPKTLIPRDEFHRIKILTAHTTDLGFCIHDFTMAPCQLHRDCINCEEQVCVKGDQVKYDALQKQLAETRRFVSDAVDAVSEGYMGSDRWLDHHTVTIQRLEKLLEVLDNPAVPSGSLIQLANENIASRIGEVDDIVLRDQLNEDPEIDSDIEKLSYFSPKNDAKIWA